MRRRHAVLIGLLLALASAAPASALPPQLRIGVVSGFEVTCGQEDTFAIGELNAKKPRIYSGPKLGEVLETRDGEPVARVVGLVRARYGAEPDIGFAGYIGWRWTVVGIGVACESAEPVRTKRYVFVLRWYGPPNELYLCGEVKRFLNFTRATVSANRFVPTCRKARTIASAWSRYQNADNGIHPMRKFSTPVTIRGYRCSGAHPVEGYSVGVTCRKKRAKVKWQWGE